MIEGKLQQLANLLIRPRRRTYVQNDLGPIHFKSKYCNCKRFDFYVQFIYGQTYGYTLSSKQSLNLKQSKPISLKCSIFTPTIYNQSNTQKNLSENICVLAMHGNTGSKISTITALQPVLKFGLAFAIFDFGGCGNSEGDYVTLGYYQKYQISAVLQHIYTYFGYHKFILYGRSMGAASALFYSSKGIPVYYLYSLFYSILFNMRVFLNYKQNIFSQQKIKSKFFQQNESYIHQKLQRIQNYCKKQQLQNKDGLILQQLVLDVMLKLNQGYFGYELIGLIADSPYYSTNDAFTDLLNQRLWFIPKLLVNYLLGLVQARANQILRRAGLGRMPQDFKCYQSQNTKLINQQSGLKKQNKPQQQKKQTPLFSILHDVKISTSAQIPFPVYIIYGLNDDVISKKHTFQLFNKLQCDHKKMHVLENQGHGNHRDDQIKIAALEWVLSWEIIRMQNIIQRDSKIIGLKLQQFVFLCNKNNLYLQVGKTKHKLKLQLKQKQLYKQFMTQKNQSIGSLLIEQSKIQFGSIITLNSFPQQNYQTVKKSMKLQQQKIDQLIMQEKKIQNKISTKFEKGVNLGMQQFFRMIRICPYMCMKIKGNNFKNMKTSQNYQNMRNRMHKFDQILKQQQ